MMGHPAGVRIWLAAGVTDLRKGFEGLSALVQTALGLNPYSGQIFVFRGRRGDRIKINLCMNTISRSELRPAG